MARGPAFRRIACFTEKCLWFRRSPLVGSYRVSLRSLGRVVGKPRKWSALPFLTVDGVLGNDHALVVRRLNGLTPFAEIEFGQPSNNLVGAAILLILGRAQLGRAALYTLAFTEGVEGGFLGKRRETRCAFSLRDCPAPPRPTARRARVRGGCRFLEAHRVAR
jgi:hypothetical protein